MELSDQPSVCSFNWLRILVLFVLWLDRTSGKCLPASLAAASLNVDRIHTSVLLGTGLAELGLMWRLRKAF